MKEYLIHYYWESIYIEMFNASKKVKSLSIQILSILFVLVILFHLLVIIGLIPNEIVWGGQISFKEELYILEGFSLLMNFLFLLIVRAAGKKLPWKVSDKAVQIGLWLMLILFSLNTIGNLLAKSSLETIIFTPITLLAAILSAVLIGKEKS